VLLFEPDVMVPAQFYAIRGQETIRGREYGLLLAVLEDAVLTFQKYEGAKSPRALLLRHEAASWIASTSETDLCDFVSICHVVGFDATVIRRKLGIHPNAAWDDRLGYRSGRRRR